MLRSLQSAEKPRGKKFALAALRAAFLLVLVLASPAQAQRRRPRHRPPPDPRTVGLGRDCHQDSSCHHPQQKCLKEADANGNPLPKGICVLPCAAIDEGTTKVIPGQPIEPTAENVAAAKKSAPPRCPTSPIKYQCRSAGAGVPIDLCVKG